MPQRERAPDLRGRRTSPGSSGLVQSGANSGYFKKGRTHPFSPQFSPPDGPKPRLHLAAQGICGMQIGDPSENAIEMGGVQTVIRVASGTAMSEHVVVNHCRALETLRQQLAPHGRAR